MAISISNRFGTFLHGTENILHWQAALKMTGVKLDLLSDPDWYFFV